MRSRFSCSCGGSFTWLLLLILDRLSGAFQPVIFHSSPAATRSGGVSSNSLLYLATKPATTTKRKKRSSKEEVGLEDPIEVLQETPQSTTKSQDGGDTISSAAVTKFVEMMDTIPVGSLKTKEAKLLRKIMSPLTIQEIGNDQEVAMMMERLLLRMMDEWRSGNQLPSLEPTVEDFILVLQAWEATIYVDENRRNTNALPIAVEHAWDLFIDLENMIAASQQQQLPSIQPTAEFFETLLRVLSSSRERGMDRKCRSVFDTLSKYDLQPTADMYNRLIVVLAKSRDKGAAHRAETFLREAVERFPTEITLDTFNVVLTAWAKSSFDYGPERAEKLIYLMDEVDRQNGGQGKLRPSVSSFTSLLDAYAQKLDWHSVNQAEKIFNRLLDEYLAGEKDLEPNVATWTIVLSAWAKLSRKGYKGAANRAERMMQRLELLRKEGRISFGPDAIVYISIMNAWAFSKTQEGPSKAHEILNEMYERYLDGDDSMKPTAKSIRIVIESFISSATPDAMECAEKFLDQYEDFLYSLGEATADNSLPTGKITEDVADVYRTMLFGWSKHGDPVRAQEYLLDMIENKMKLDPFCFDKVIEGNTQLNDSRAMERSQEIFQLMEQCRREGSVNPNERVYTSFIRAMTKARVPNLATKAHTLLKRMQELAIENKAMQPEVFTYNAVLMACAETPLIQNPNPSEAFAIAIKVFNELRSSPKGPDHVSFGNMLRCANLIPAGEQKDSLIRSTFQLCCRSGCVNTFVIRDLKSVAQDELWRSLLGCSPDSEVDLDQLPSSWTRMSSMKQRQKDLDPVRKFR